MPSWLFLRNMHLDRSHAGLLLGLFVPSTNLIPFAAANFSLKSGSSAVSSGMKSGSTLPITDGALNLSS